MRIAYDFSSCTDPGLVRSKNEDSVAFDAASQLAVLADGMGGYNAGEIASSIATFQITSEMRAWLSRSRQEAKAQDVFEALERSVNHANRCILEAAKANRQLNGMATTLVVGVFRQHCLWLGHLGDSRCYRLRGSEFRQITKDHSWVQEQMDAGQLTPEQAAASDQKNLVTRALGVQHGVKLETHQHLTELGDMYLMCTDGLTDMLTDPMIAAIIAQTDGLQAKAQALVNAANAQGGRDNITVLLVQAKVASR
jgi:PPM family protein phosphatase